METEVSDLYINASVTVKNKTVKRNGALYYSDESPEVEEFLANLYKFSKAKYPKFYKMDQLSKLGWLTAEILIDDEFKEQNYRTDEVGIVLSNASASLDTDIRYYESVADIPSPALFVYTLPNIVSGEISIRHGFKGENAFFIFAEFRGLLQFY